MPEKPPSIVRLSEAADAQFVKAFGEIAARIAAPLSGADRAQLPVKMYLAGGAAVHCYTGARTTGDIDAVFSRRLLLPDDLDVNYIDAKGQARLLYLDRQYNDTLALMHEDAQVDAIPLPLVGVDPKLLEVRLLTPVDLAVGVRFEGHDQEVRVAAGAQFLHGHTRAGQRGRTGLTLAAPPLELRRGSVQLGPCYATLDVASTGRSSTRPPTEPANQAPGGVNEENSLNLHLSVERAAQIVPAATALVEASVFGLGVSRRGVSACMAPLQRFGWPVAYALYKSRFRALPSTAAQGLLRGQTRRFSTRVPYRPIARSAIVAAGLALAGGATLAQPAPEVLEPIVVTGTRTEARAFDLPMSIDVISRGDIQNGKPRINISEDLNRVPGTFVQNRENFAQELQISIRGFGARSQFGTRGVKLIVDGLPASTPDGQGNPGMFDLGSAERIEVLRGPFSALYGNHSGGVVQVFSERGVAPPLGVADAEFGSYGLQRYAVKGAAAAGAFGGMASASYFSLDGYRDHSAASKSQLNTNLSYDINANNRLTAIATGFDLPNAQDPLGLTQQQVQQNPRQAQPVAIAFNARRSLDQFQGGLIWDSTPTAASSLRVLAYGGGRGNEQYLAVPLENQVAPTSSGGVSVLDRQFGGAGIRWTHRQDLAEGPLTLTVGADYDSSSEDRQGYINNLGVRGDLKRDENNDVDSLGAYAQVEWRFLPRWSVSAGVRHTKVDFTSTDRYIRTGNPDDSGSTSYSEWTPTVGLLFAATPAINLYVSYGRAFETPTTVELAYRPDGSSGLNFALQPAISDQVEFGVKAMLGDSTRVNLAAFAIRTSGEIVIARSTGGRASYQNASETARSGVELMLDSDLGRGFSTHIALTWLKAQFDEAFRSCAPLATFCNPVTGANTAVVPAGNVVPGVPDASLFANLAYRNPGTGFSGAVEVIANGKVAVDDFNSAFASGYAIANAVAGFEQTMGRWRLRQFARVNNLFGRQYIGAVVVGDANGRYYAPAPTRNVVVSIAATYTFK